MSLVSQTSGTLRLSRRNFRQQQPPLLQLEATPQGVGPKQFSRAAWWWGRGTAALRWYEKSRHDTASTTYLVATRTCSSLRKWWVGSGDDPGGRAIPKLCSVLGGLTACKCRRCDGIRRLTSIECGICLGVALDAVFHSFEVFLIPPMQRPFRDNGHQPLSTARV